MGEIQVGGVIEHLGAVPLLKSPNARVFVVDPSDSGFTLQDAIDECVAGIGDVILCLPGGQTVTTAVNFNKAGITVMAVNRGLNPLVSGEYFAILADAAYTDGPVANITAYCKIIGMGFASRDTGATFYSGAAALIGGMSDANPFGAHLKQCRFPKWGLDNRIGLAMEGTSDCLIEECTFEGVGSALDVGIYLQGAMQNPIIRNNYFRQCTAAIQFGAFAGGGPHAIIHGNKVEDGLILDSQANTATGFVLDNYSELATGASYDASVATLQAQGIQFAGNHYSE